MRGRQYFAHRHTIRKNHFPRVWDFSKFRYSKRLYYTRLHVVEYRPPNVNEDTLAISLHSYLSKHRDRVPRKLLNEDVTGMIGWWFARGCEGIPPLCALVTEEENDNGRGEERETESGNGVPRHRKIAAPLEAAVNRPLTHWMLHVASSRTTTHRLPPANPPGFICIRGQPVPKTAFDEQSNKGRRNHCSTFVIFYFIM